MKVVLSRTLALFVLLSMALVTVLPATGAAMLPTQAPSEGDMITSMAAGGDWLLTVSMASGQLNPPVSAQPWEVESAGRLAMVGMALLKAYQVTGKQAYMDRAVACGDLLASSVDAGVAYVVDRTGVLPTEAGGGFPNVQMGKVDDAHQGGFAGPVRFQLWESLRGIWFLSELYRETGSNVYATAATLLDRLLGDQFYGNDDPINGLAEEVTLASNGAWTQGTLAATSEHGIALQGVLVAGNSLPNLWRDQYSIISYISNLQQADGSIDDRVIMPGQDNTSETRHAMMIPALFGLGGLREARNLLAWVKTQQLFDGSFACPHDKDPFGDTASSVFGLLPSGEVAAGGDGLFWLIDAQQVDGSWNFVPNHPPDASQIKSTTWALLAVHAGLTNYNLRVDASMVETEMVWEGDPSRVTGFRVNVTVANDGLVEVVNASVRVYDGPREVKLLLDEVSIDVPALGDATTTLDFFPEERGPHEVHVWVVYEPGGEFRTRDNNASVRVNINRQPTGAIGSPERGHLFGFGAFILFEAVDVVDPDEDVVVFEWTDNVTGFISDQPAFHKVLPPGDHSVVLVLSDGNGPDTRLNVTFSVRQNIPPTVRISTPADGDQYFDYQPITFDASASSDAEEHPLEFTWLSDLDGRLGVGDHIVKRLSPGNHRITVWVDDGWDNVSKHVDIRIIETYPPVPVISMPVDGEKYVTTTRVQFDSAGTADPDSDVLEFFWTSNIDGLLSQRPSFLAKLTVGHHRITLAVTDGNYNVTKMVEIDVLDNRPPVAIISSPLDEAVYNSTDIVELNGTASYDLEDPITYFWISDRSGPLGSDNFIMTKLARGEHTITLWVNDGYSHNVSAVVMVTVRNLGPTAGISSPSEDGTYVTGQSILFSSASSTDPEDDRLTYEWYVRMGEGDWQSMGTSASAQRNFDRPGRYQVKLVVKDVQFTSEAISSFTIGKGTEGGEEEGLPILTIAIIVVLLVIAILAAVMLLRQGGEEYS